jgi:hypothetical protein
MDFVKFTIFNKISGIKLIAYELQGQELLLVRSKINMFLLLEVGQIKKK